MPTCAWRLAAHCCTARGAAPLWWQAMHAWLSLDVPLASLEMSGVVGAPPCAKAEATARGTPHSKTMNGRARGSYFICGAPFPLPFFCRSPHSWKPKAIQKAWPFEECRSNQLQVGGQSRRRQKNADVRVDARADLPAFS